MNFIKRFYNFIKIRSVFLFRYIYWNSYKPKSPLNLDKRDFHIVASLTTFPARLKHLNITIKSLMKQNLKADKIILYLGTDTKQSSIPKKLLKLQKYGLEIIYDCNDLKPHKKYLFAAKEYPNSFIVTVDDDLIYDKDMIEDLWNTHLKYPSAVCARRVHLIKKENNSLLPYSNWETESSSKTTPTHSLFSTNGAGTLFPLHTFDEIFLNEELISKLCLNADDIWIKFNLIRNNIPVVWTGKFAFMPKEIFYPKNKNVTLMSQNVTRNKNDEYIDILQEYFNIKLVDYCD